MWISIVSLLNLWFFKKKIEISKYMVIIYQIRNIVVFLDFEQRRKFQNGHQIIFGIMNVTLSLIVNQFFMIYIFDFWKCLPFIIILCVMQPVGCYIMFPVNENESLWQNFKDY